MNSYQPFFDISQPNFEVDLAYGHEGEETVRKFLRFIQSGSYEVKSDRYRNGRMVVEMEQNPKGRGWKPSGLSITQATVWAYMYAPDALVMCSSARLRDYIDKEESTLKYMEFASGTENPTQGFLIYPEQVMQMLSDRKYDG